MFYLDNSQHPKFIVIHESLSKVLRVHRTHGGTGDQQNGEVYPLIFYTEDHFVVKFSIEQATLNGSR
jgi:hypothetical protein